ncbi:bZIP-like protein [Gossypium australe]|uniref:BZIP-like protein n=1 Tax=Gossypium australe TaxID=47621 RepID=A0A5B6VED3_9ROSI|nr:bZIP-like protein [Gossypium australe]
MVGRNLFSIVFDLEEDLELIMEGRSSLFRKFLILFDRLINPLERDQICLTTSPYWIHIGLYPPEFDKKNLMHAIGSTFGGVLIFEISGDLCRLRVNLDVQKPLRRGIFVSSENSCVNYNKSTIFYSSNTTEEAKAVVSSMLGVKSSSNPKKYLGLPYLVGKWKKEAFQNLVDRINSRIDGWSSRLLSQGGKEFL